MNELITLLRRKYQQLIIVFRMVTVDTIVK